MLDLFKEVTHLCNLRKSLKLVLTKSKLCVMVQTPSPKLVQKFGQLFQTK